MSRLSIRRAVSAGDVGPCSISVEAADLPSALAVLRALVDNLDADQIERFASLPKDEQDRIIDRAAAESLKGGGRP